MTTLIQILPFTSLGTKMVSISLSNGGQIQTNCWLTEDSFDAMLETLNAHRETSPEKSFTFDLTDDGKRAE